MTKMIAHRLVRAAPAAILAIGVAITPARADSDPERGARLYESRCVGCHSLDANRIGPRHRGVYGRRAGSVPGFDYSSALKNAAIVWDAAMLDRWLANPQALVPGQRMNFRVTAERDRADIIAYLKRESGK